MMQTFGNHAGAHCDPAVGLGGYVCDDLFHASKEWLAGFAVLHGLGLATAGFFGDCGPLFYSTSALGTSALLYRIRKIDLNNPSECMDAFVENKWYGMLIFAGTVLDRLMY